MDPWGLFEVCYQYTEQVSSGTPTTGVYDGVAEHEKIKDAKQQSAASGGRQPVSVTRTKCVSIPDPNPAYTPIDPGFGAPSGGPDGGGNGGDGGEGPKRDLCNTFLQRAGDFLEGSGDAVIYAGIGTTVTGAAAGSALPGVGTAAGASPGIVITFAGGVVASAGQVLQDINHGVNPGIIVGRALANAAVGRAGSKLARLSDRTIVPNLFDDFVADTALGQGAASAIEFLDPQRCP